MTIKGTITAQGMVMQGVFDLLYNKRNKEVMLPAKYILKHRIVC
jgi:hypothetical protein